MARQEDEVENVNRCSGHEAVSDSELHRLVRHKLGLPEPRGSNALTDEEREDLERKVRECNHCQGRFGILERGEGLRREESGRRLAEGAVTAQIAPERLERIRAAYEEQFARGAKLRAQLTAAARSGASLRLGGVGAENLKQLRTAVANDDQNRLVSLLTQENTLAAADPHSAWASKTELLLERLLSEVRDSGDMATQKSLAAAEDFFVTNNGDFKRSPVDVSAFHEQKHFVCFLILLGFQTFLGLLRRSPEPYRASVPGKELSSGGRLDLRPFFGPGAQIFAARQRHRVITLVPRPEVEY